MKFEEYKNEVLKFGQRIGWDFIFRDRKHKGVELLAPTVNNLNPLIKWFSREYIEMNKEWTPELNWLKQKLLGR